MQVLARIDIGFGNHLFIRGEGNGLSWAEGQPLTCLESATWVWSGGNGSDGSIFKLLLNDEIWCQGENLIVRAREQVEIEPRF
jgi:hypothetical protein